MTKASTLREIRRVGTECFWTKQYPKARAIYILWWSRTGAVNSDEARATDREEVAIDSKR